MHDLPAPTPMEQNMNPSTQADAHSQQAQQQPQQQTQSQQQQQPQSTAPKSLTHSILNEKRRNKQGEWVTKRSYEIMTKLGKGGFAKVYLAKELASSQQYAIKVIDKASIEKDSYKEKLNQEIRFQKTLTHENVVKYFSSFEDSKNVYIVLEYCSNQTFKELMDRRKRLTEIEAKSHLLQIIRSLKYIHSQGIIHRDLKIANIFLNAKMEVKLADFGLSASLKYPETKRKTVCGTPNYIAPEVLKNQGHDFQVDSWAVGVIAYTFLIGKPPFEEKEAENTLKNIKMNRYAFPENCSLSQEAMDFIKQILIPNPIDRMNIDEMLVHPFLQNTSIIIPPTMPISTLALPPTARYLSSLLSSSTAAATTTTANATAQPTTEFNQQRLTSSLQSLSLNALKRNPSQNQPNQGQQENAQIIQSQMQTTKSLAGFKSVAGNANINTTPSSSGAAGLQDNQYASQNKQKSQATTSSNTAAGMPFTVSVIDSIDMRGQLGVAFILNNGTVGILLNDGRVIQLSDSSTLEVISKEQSKHQIKRFNDFELPEEYEEYYDLVVRMRETFQKRNVIPPIPLQGTSAAASAMLQKEVTLKKFIVTDKAQLFRFNNRNLQAFFVDGTQLIICLHTREILFKDIAGKLSRFALHENQNVPTDIRKRFDYIRLVSSSTASQPQQIQTKYQQQKESMNSNNNQVTSPRGLLTSQQQNGQLESNTISQQQQQQQQLTLSPRIQMIVSPRQSQQSQQQSQQQQQLQKQSQQHHQQQQQQQQQLQLPKNSNMTNSLTNMSTSTQHQTPLLTAMTGQNSQSIFPSLNTAILVKPGQPASSIITQGSNTLKQSSNMPTPRSRFY